MNKRYHAADIKKGYNIPDFKKIANAYNLKYIKIKNYKDLNKLNISNKPSLIEVFIKKNTLIEPKMGFGGLINDQFPSMSDEDFLRYNKFVFFKRREIKKIPLLLQFFIFFLILNPFFSTFPSDFIR